MNRETYCHRLCIASNVALALAAISGQPLFDTPIPYVYTLYVLYLMASYCLTRARSRL